MEWTFRTPFAGTNRIRFSGCVLSLDDEAPRYPKATIGHMTVGVGLWDDLLQGEELAYLGSEAAREARAAPLPDDLPSALRERLEARGIDSLYSHQAEAWEAARRGEHFVVTTGTASGKSLAFNLPVLAALAEEPKLRALYLYPTKALAQDQVRALDELQVKRVRPAIYDGDTESERRWQIRKWSNLILTNPDMLHVGVLPHHDRWGDVLSNLRYVVVDEAHVYRGVFGSHVGNVLRRLRRLARVYGSEPQFLLASATIGNPGELASSLTGLDFTVIGDDGAPKAERTIALWNPELIDEELGQRASALADSSKLMADLVERGLRTLVFAKSRRAAELVHKFSADRHRRRVSALALPRRLHARSATRDRAAALRGRAARRQRDERARARDRRRVAGRGDLGRLPGTVASLRQQWGRAGRRGTGSPSWSRAKTPSTSTSCAEPETLLGRRVEAAILDHENPRVLDGHVAAAAFEAPLDEAGRGHPRRRKPCGAPPSIPELEKTDAGYVWARAATTRPGRFGLRSTSPDVFTVVETETGSVLGTIERERAYSTVHEGAIYLHLGESYRVLALDLAARSALVEPFTGDYYTQTKKETTTSIEETLRTERRLGLDLAFGRVSVDRAGRRLPEEVDPRPVDARARRARPAGDDLRDRGGLVRARARPAGRPARDAEAPRHAARRRARDHRNPAAVGDVRPLGHRGLSTNLHFQTGRPTVSSTTATPAAWKSPSTVSRPSRAGSRTRRRCSTAALAKAAARPASSRRSAAISTSPSTRPARSSC